jgi:hypothetical protein
MSERSCVSSCIIDISEECIARICPLMYELITKGFQMRQYVTLAADCSYAFFYFPIHGRPQTDGIRKP